MKIIATPDKLRLTADEIALVRDYRGMPEEDQVFIAKLANALQEDAGAIPPPKLLTVVDGRPS